MWTWLRCLFGFHDRLLLIENARLSLRCVNCRHQSPGWTLTDPPPRVTFRGVAATKRLG